MYSPRQRRRTDREERQGEGREGDRDERGSVGCHQETRRIALPLPRLSTGSRGYEELGDIFGCTSAGCRGKCFMGSDKIYKLECGNWINLSKR